MVAFHAAHLSEISFGKDQQRKELGHDYGISLEVARFRPAPFDKSTALVENKELRRSERWWTPTLLMGINQTQGVRALFFRAAVGDF